MTDAIIHTNLPVQAKLIPFNLPIMNQEESIERDQREERYRGSQDDIHIIRHELNKLSGAVGELVVALRGNDFGSDGLIARVKEIEVETDKMKKRVDQIELVAKGRELHVRIIWGLVCFILGTAFVEFLRYLSPVYKK
ncbi:MAG TPA: hypothetical protein VK890_09300 [Bacteroidia bacterium]|jgi:hypothetical protein|nr:hypothetical protein [Bacteroidia bacterium]